MLRYAMYFTVKIIIIHLTSIHFDMSYRLLAHLFGPRRD